MCFISCRLIVTGPNAADIRSNGQFQLLAILLFFSVTLLIHLKLLSDGQVPYAIAIETIGGDPEAMAFPTLNISSKGVVPNKTPQIFR